MRVFLVVIPVLIMTSAAFADDKTDRARYADTLDHAIDDLGKLCGSCDRDDVAKIAEVRGRLKALREEINGPQPTKTTTTTTAGPKAMDDKSFDKLAQRVSAESFSDSKLRVVREAAASNHFRAEQVAKLLGAMTMEDDKLKALSSLASKIVDPQNDFVIDGAFTFDSGKKKAEQILNAAKKP